MRDNTHPINQLSNQDTQDETKFGSINTYQFKTATAMLTTSSYEDYDHHISDL